MLRKDPVLVMGLLRVMGVPMEALPRRFNHRCGLLDAQNRLDSYLGSCCCCHTLGHTLQTCPEELERLRRKAVQAYEAVQAQAKKMHRT